MNTEKLPGGLWPVMLTPFTDDNEIDLPGLERLTRFYIKAGSSGLFANCLSSEMFQLTENERLSIIKTTVDTCQSLIPVIATGSFSIHINKNIEFIKKVYDLGVKAVIINTSLLVERDADESVLKNHLEKILSATGIIPLGVYECPIPYKRLLSPGLMHWMADTGRFLYMKDTSCDLSDIETKLKVIANSPLQLYNANIPTGLSSLQKGAAGLSPIGANFYPEIYAWMAKNYNNAGKEKIIRRINARLSVIDPLLHTFYPFSAKMVLQKRGLSICSQTRKQTESMTSQDKTKFTDLMTVFEEMAVEAGISLIRFDEC